MAFDPEVNQEIIIDNIAYCFAEHPAAPGMPYGQTGRAATVYKLESEHGNRAFKVFVDRFRSPSLVTLTARLAPFAEIPGLSVCNRSVLTPQRHANILRPSPDLIYAVLMPWIEGPTWLQIMQDKQVLSFEQSLTLARELAMLLSNLEQQGLAHCDLSNANLLLPGLAENQDGASQAPVELVDVEQLYANTLVRPALVPSGSEGYAHKTVKEGVWEEKADRFAGAILIAEILGWADPVVRDLADGESYFSHGELQDTCARFNRLHGSIERNWGEGTSRLFERAWHSDFLADCPTFGEWLLAIPERVPDKPAVDLQENSSVSEYEIKPTDVNQEVIAPYNVFPEAKGEIQATTDQEYKPNVQETVGSEEEIFHRQRIDLNVRGNYAQGNILDLDKPKRKSRQHFSRYLLGIVTFALIILLGISVFNLWGNTFIPSPTGTPIGIVTPEIKSTSTLIVQDLSSTPTVTSTPTITPIAIMTQTLTPAVTPTLGVKNLGETISSKNIDRMVNIFSLGRQEPSLTNWLSHGVIISRSNRYIAQLLPINNYESLKGQVFDLWTGKLLQEIEPLQELSFSPDEDQLAYIHNGEIKLRSVTADQTLRSFNIGKQFVRFISKNSILTDYGGYVAIVNTETQKQELAFLSYGESVKIRTSTDNKVIANLGWRGSNYEYLQVWATATQNLLFEAPVQYSSDFVITADHKRIIFLEPIGLSSEFNGRISIADLTSGEVVSTFDVNQKFSKVHDYLYPSIILLISEDQSMLIFSTGDKNIYFLDLEKRSVVKTINYESEVSGMELSQNGKMLAVSSNGLLYIYGIGQ